MPNIGLVDYVEGQTPVVVIGTFLVCLTNRLMLPAILRPRRRCVRGAGCIPNALAVATLTTLQPVIFAGTFRFLLRAVERA